jgi:formylglycine-generating enzyme required for sulfatase activity
MAATLVTQYQWEQVMGKDANRSRFMGKDDDEKMKLPVDNVSWDDCQVFCKKLSEREGRKYELPTEAEWEYACRAGTTSPFWWGKTITTAQANYSGAFAYGKDGKTGVSRGKTTTVEQFAANPWGLFDMHGNLYQWCQDWYNLYLDRDLTDPASIEKGAADARVLRGGSWFDYPRSCRAACRRGGGPAYRNGGLGCRVVCRLD